MKLNKFHSF